MSEQIAIMSLETAVASSKKRLKSPPNRCATFPSAASRRHSQAINGFVRFIASSSSARLRRMRKVGSTDGRNDSEVMSIQFPAPASKVIARRSTFLTPAAAASLFSMKKRMPVLSEHHNPSLKIIDIWVSNHILN